VAATSLTSTDTPATPQAPHPFDLDRSQNLPCKATAGRPISSSSNVPPEAGFEQPGLRTAWHQ